jgi:hypothetical protein
MKTSDKIKLKTLLEQFLKETDTHIGGDKLLDGGSSAKLETIWSTNNIERAKKALKIIKNGGFKVELIRNRSNYELCVRTVDAYRVNKALLKGLGIDSWDQIKKVNWE